MTAAQLAMDYYEAFLGSHTDRGVSTEAKEIKDRIEVVRGEILKSFSLGESYRDSLSSLCEIAGQAAASNWDGYGAMPVNSLSIHQALRLLRTLPTTLPKPELSVDPDGEISFEWHFEPRRVFSISIGPHGELSYAGLFGRSDAHGTEYFGDEIPKPIVDNLNRLFSRSY
ncbi:MAG: hypothetical protein QUT30_03420 [Acidobacteriota bacterium]|nr:hypothetical protein [Acidobacteriota bacterium]